MSDAQVQYIAIAIGVPLGILCLVLPIALSTWLFERENRLRAAEEARQGILARLADVINQLSVGNDCECDDPQEAS